MESRLSASDQGFDVPTNEEAEESTNNTPALYLQDEESDTAANVEQSQFIGMQLNELRTALNTLDQRSLEIVQARWLNDENKATLHQLADKYGVSAERIRQLEKNALLKLKSAIVV